MHPYASDKAAPLEKGEPVNESPAVTVQGHVLGERDWTDAEERKAVFKLDLVLVLTLMLGFFALQLDKTNISSAITTDFTTDISITNNIVNAGGQLQLAAIVIFEIPSNMILAKVGAPTWLTFQCFSWGMVATFQAFVSNKATFYATRFILGTFEAGYLAGSLLVIGTFYTKTESAMRMTVLYTANYLAASVSSLIAAGVFQLDGAAGLKDWQWLFIIDGVFTVLVSFIFLWVLPTKPQWTRPRIGIAALDVFSERERDIMTRRLALEDKVRGMELSSLSFSEVFSYLTKGYLIWAHAVIAIVSISPKGGLLLYAPTLIKNLGFDTIQANLLAAVPNFSLIVLAMMAAKISDKTRLRGPVCAACTVYALVFAGVQYDLVSSEGKWTKYAVFVCFMAGNATFQGINSAWLSSNLRDPKALCVGQAVIVMATNIGGLVGSQLFRDEDAPQYTRGFLSIMCLYGGTLILVIGLTGLYWMKNRKLSRPPLVHRPSQDDDEFKFEI